MFRSSIWTIISARYLTPTPPRPYRPNGHLHLTTYNLTDQIYTPTGIASAEIKVGDRERTRNELAGYTVYAFEIRKVSTHNMPLANAHQHQGSRDEGLILGLFTTESTTCPTEMRHNFGRTHGNTRKQRNKMNHKLRRATDTTPL